MSLQRPSEAARLLGVTTQTLRARHRKGLIEAVQEEGTGHRRYVIVDPLLSIRGDGSESTKQRQRIVYARVSSRKQLGDLERQIASLEAARPGYRVVSDVGSGLNFKRRGLLHILDLAISHRLEELVVTHRDRLVRFGFELIEHVLRGHGALLTVLHAPDVQGDPGGAAELADDLLSIVTVFAARHHGRRRGLASRTEVQEDSNLPDQNANSAA